MWGGVLVYWCIGEGGFLGKGSEGQTLKVFGRE